MRSVRRLACVLSIVACGRVSFDPLGTTGSGGDPGDGGGGSDGSAATGSDGSTLPAACAEAMTILVNQPAAPIDTCSTGFDRIDACGPLNTKEIVYKFVVPTSGNYTVKTTDTGTMGVISTGDVDTACTGTTMCNGITSTAFTAGDVHYYAIEAGNGGCITVQLSITMP